MTRFHIARWLLPASICTLLCACGGGGGGGGGGDSISIGDGNDVKSKPGRLQFSASTVAVGESEGNVVLTITRTDDSGGAVSVTVTSRDGTATHGQDHIAISTTVSFADGDASAKTVSVPIISDTVDEPDETFYVRLSAPTGGAELGSVAELLVTVIDDDMSRPAAPVATLKAVYKKLRIEWEAADGATTYQVLQDPDGSGLFRPIGDSLPASARSADIEVVPLKNDWVHTLYRISACNDAGCAFSSTLSVAGLSTPLIAYVKPSNTNENQRFGWSVALSADGNTLAVGAMYDGSAATGIDGNQVADCDSAAQVNCSPDAGAVYVYTRTGSTWSTPTYIKASNIGMSNSGDEFGSVVTLSADGNTLAVGAPVEGSDTTGVGSTANDDAPASGAAYVYSRTGSTWSGPVYIKASNTGSAHHFGSAVALSGDGKTLAVGAAGANAVHLYTRSGGTWASVPDYISPPNADRFGGAVALNADGSVLAVGAAGESSAGTGIDPDPHHDCGMPSPVNCNFGSGAVYVYSYTESAWSAAPTFIKPHGFAEGFGSSLALSSDGNTLAIGTYAASFVEVLDRIGGSWTLNARMSPPSVNPDNEFGLKVALSADGNTVAAGAFWWEGTTDAGLGGPPTSGSGEAFVFSRNENSWSAPLVVRASNPERYDDFGSALALSADGTTLAVSAPSEGSAATGVNGNMIDGCEDDTPTNCVYWLGAVYVY